MSEVRDMSEAAAQGPQAAAPTPPAPAPGTPAPAAPRGPRVESRWLPMRDGMRIAIDLIRPATDEGAPFPAVMLMTRSWRSFALRIPISRAKAPMGPRAPIADELVTRGYAVVVVDARGTGASEGTWRYPWSPEEQADYREVVDWIVAQPWSNGRVGATGISYEGTTAMLLGASGHPAVRAVAARSFERDVYPDIALPGGVLNRAFLRAWSDAARQLDADRVPALFGFLGGLFVRGVRPVDEDPAGRELAAIVGKRHNPDVYQAISGITFRDDPYGGEGVTLDDLSVLASLARLREAAVPAQVWGSWFDGTTADSALRLFAELPSVREVHIGAWSHTGEQHASPFGEGERPDPPLREQWQRILGFLDGPLRGHGPVSTERIIHYFTMGEERWRSTPAWPPTGLGQATLYLEAVGQLSPDLPRGTTVDRHALDARASTGTHDRWHTQLARDVRYGDRAVADRRLATWTGAPLPQPVEITGHPEVRLFVRTAGQDLSLFVYLEAVDPTGRVRMLTEGLLRALHRAPLGLEVTFLRGDAIPIRPGQLMDMRIRMLPTSVVLPEGWRVRLALAGANAQTFAATTSAADLDIVLEYGPDRPASLSLPVRAA